MPSIRPLISGVILSTLLLIMLSGCGGDPESPEQQIREMLSAGEEAVEARSVSRVKPFLSQSYSDEEGRQQRDILRLVTGYFLRNQSIHLLVQIQEIRLLGEERAEVDLYAAIAAKPIESAEQLVDYRADLFRFELGLIRQGEDWQVTGGRWRRASRADFLE